MTAAGTVHVYRPDVDGLRALAVLAVLAYHAFPQSAPGGFAGVDVFFVISGFLITGIILDGLQDGGFTFADFYWRRIRRIFPALILVLAVSLGCGWLLLLPDEFAHARPARRRRRRLRLEHRASGARRATSTPPRSSSRCCTCGRSASRSSSTWSGRCCCSSSARTPGACSA